MNRSIILRRLSPILGLVFFSFVLGGYSFRVTGACVGSKIGEWGGVAIILALIGLLITGFQIFCGYRKSTT